MQQAQSISELAQFPQVDEDPRELQALKIELAYYQDAPGSRAEAMAAYFRQQIEAYCFRERIIMPPRKGSRGA